LALQCCVALLVENNMNMNEGLGVGLVCVRGRGTGGGGNGGMCPPDFLKVKKVPFFLGLNAPFKERKKYLLNKRPLFHDYY
jgi:hypothetical protein